MQDALLRPLRTLRLSVTDRCNFRCPYCMPREPVFLDRKDLLAFEEMTRLCGLLARLGVRKIRITGGEPLVRRGLPDLVDSLARLPGVEELALTTNGSLLGALARPLKEAGLRQATVSLDSLDPEGFARLSGNGSPLAAVLDGIQAAVEAGLQPVKLNCMVQRGVNEDQVLPIVAFARARGLEARFIEYMDSGTQNGWHAGAVVPSAELRRRVGSVWPLDPLPAPQGTGPATRFRFLDGAGVVGFISSVTEPFCGGCDRIRLSAEGRVYTCLFAGSGLDLRTPLRAGVADGDLEELVRSVWTRREDRYSEQRTPHTSRGCREEMFRLGG